MAESLSCWKCGTPLEAVLLPIGRRDECPACGADLHACRMCEFYDPAVSKSCREPMADEVEEKERANFCDYFRATPRPAAAGGGTEAEAARAKLQRLFGGKAGFGDEAGGTSGALEREARAAQSKARDEAAAARERLDKLFGSKRNSGKDQE
jgi:hypothetical protein